MDETTGMASGGRQAVERYDVFLSYSRNGLGPATLLLDQLEAAGLKVFRDQESIREGDLWLNKLQDAVEACGSFDNVVVRVPGRHAEKDQRPRALVTRRLLRAAPGTDRLDPLTLDSGGYDGCVLASVNTFFHRGSVSRKAGQVQATAQHLRGNIFGSAFVSCAVDTTATCPARPSHRWHHRGAWRGARHHASPAVSLPLWLALIAPSSYESRG